MHNTSVLLEELVNSPLYMQLKREADKERQASHAAAVDALLAHEADTAAIEQAGELAEQARRALVPLEATAQAARQNLHEAETLHQQMSWGHERKSNVLRAEANKHLPAVMGAVENALIFTKSDIRAAIKTRERKTRWGVAYDSNIAEIEAALAQADRLHDLLGELAMQPMPADEINKRLSAEVSRLIDLAKAAGAFVGIHFPEEVRSGRAVEMPEREKRRLIFPC